MRTLDLLGWVKRSDIEIVQISIFCLILAVYDLSDTQDRLRCGEMGFVLCGKHPVPMTRVQVSDQGTKAPLFDKAYSEFPVGYTSIIKPS